MRYVELYRATMLLVFILAQLTITLNITYKGIIVFKLLLNSSVAWIKQGLV
jgi:hypothetical protein